MERGLPSDGGTTVYENDVEVQPANTSAQINFNAAWDNYLNGNTSVQNYKVLDGYFLTGSAVGANYTTYKITVNGVTTTNTVTNNPGTTPLF